MAKKIEKPLVIDTTDKITVISTEEHPYIEEGTEYIAHPIVAKLNIEQGFANLPKGVELPVIGEEEEKL